jgi:hypothetical protein
MAREHSASAAQVNKNHTRKRRKMEKPEEGPDSLLQRVSKIQVPNFFY